MVLFSGYLLVAAVPGRYTGIGVHEHDNRISILLDFAGDTVEISFPEVLFGAEFSAPLKKILLDLNSQVSIRCQALDVIDVPKMSDDLVRQRAAGSLHFQLIYSSVRTVQGDLQHSTYESFLNENEHGSPFYDISLVPVSPVTHRQLPPVAERADQAWRCFLRRPLQQQV